MMAQINYALAAILVVRPVLFPAHVPHAQLPV